jgi:hypothetical protein
MNEADVQDKQLRRRKIEQLGIELRVRGFSYQEICKLLKDREDIDISATKLQGVIDRAIGRAPIQNATICRSLEDMRLDMAMKPMMRILEWDPDKPKEGVPPPSATDFYRAAETIRKLSERRSAMNGINLQQTMMSSGMVGAQEDAYSLQVVFKKLVAENDESETPEADS